MEEEEVVGILKRYQNIWKEVGKENVQIVCVSKTVDKNILKQLHAKDPSIIFAENYVQYLLVSFLGNWRKRQSFWKAHNGTL